MEPDPHFEILENELSKCQPWYKFEGISMRGSLDINLHSQPIYSTVVKISYFLECMEITADLYDLPVLLVKL